MRSSLSFRYSSTLYLPAGQALVLVAEKVIGRAAADYRTALGLYQSVAPYGNANARIVRIQNDLESVNTRLQQIELSEAGGPAVGSAINAVRRLLQQIAPSKAGGPVQQ